MKKKYEKPEAMKITFNYKDQLIATSGDIFTPITSNSIANGCNTAPGNSPWNLQNKKDGCSKK